MNLWSTCGLRIISKSALNHYARALCVSRLYIRFSDGRHSRREENRKRKYSNLRGAPKSSKFQKCSLAGNVSYSNRVGFAVSAFERNFWLSAQGIASGVREDRGKRYWLLTRVELAAHATGSTSIAASGAASATTASGASATTSAATSTS